MDDRNLVQTFIKSKGRDLQSFNKIVRKYESIVYGLSLKYLRNTEFAEEVSQEVFFKVYSKLETLKSPDQLKSWVMRITVNTCADFYRKQKKAREIKEQSLKELKLEPPVEDLSVSKMDRLRTAMEKLNEDEREILMLHYFSEMKVAEIASQFSLGVSAVKMRLHRVREKLLKIMKEDKYEDH